MFIQKQVRAHFSVRFGCLMLMAFCAISCGQVPDVENKSDVFSDPAFGLPAAGDLLDEIAANQLSFSLALSELESIWQAHIVAAGPEAMSQILETMPFLTYLLRLVAARDIPIEQATTILRSLLEIVRPLLPAAAAYLGALVEIMAPVTALFALNTFVATGLAVATNDLVDKLEEQRDELDPVRCAYYVLDGPRLGNYLPGGVLFRRGADADAAAMRSAVERVLAFAQALVSFLASNSAELTALSGNAGEKIICGHVAYDPSALDVQYNEFRKAYRGAVPDERQPVRRITIVALGDVEGNDVVAQTRTDDHGFYAFRLEDKSDQIQAIVVRMQLQAYDYEPDGIGPEWCNGSQWFVPLEVAQGTAPLPDIGPYKMEPGHVSPRPKYISRLSTEQQETGLVDIYFSYHGRQGEFDWEKQMFRAAYHLDLVLMYFELLCKAEANYFFPNFVMHHQDLAPQVLDKAGEYYLIQVPPFIGAVDFLHELMHGMEFMIYQRADNKNVTGQGYDEDARSMFSEGWNEAHQIFILDDGTAHRIAGHQDMYDHEAFDLFTPTLYTMARAVKTLIEIEKLVGYARIHSTRAGQFSETSAFTTLWAYLAYLYDRSGFFTRANIEMIIQRYLGFDAQGFRCADEFCAALNGNHAPIDAFDTQNKIGERAAEAGYDADDWALYDLVDACPMIEGHRVSTHGSMYSGVGEGIPSTALPGDRPHNRFYACLASRLPDPTAGIRDTGSTCNEETSTLQLNAYKKGRRFLYEEAEHWGDHGLIDQVEGICPGVVINNADGVVLFDVAKPQGGKLDCFSFQEDGCAHFRVGEE